MRECNISNMKIGIVGAPVRYHGDIVGKVISCNENSTKICIDDDIYKGIARDMTQKLEVLIDVKEVR